MVIGRILGTAFDAPIDLDEIVRVILSLPEKAQRELLKRLSKEWEPLAKLRNGPQAKKKRNEKRNDAIASALAQEIAKNDIYQFMLTNHNELMKVKGRYIGEVNMWTVYRRRKKGAEPKRTIAFIEDNCIYLPET